MDLHPIHTHEDLLALEGRPYQAFMPYTSVFEALQATATRFGERPALRYIRSADLGEPPQVWTCREFVGQIQRAAGLFQALAGDAEPRVAMLLPAIPQAYLTLWGAEACGVACPINHLLNADHIAELIKASDANLLVALGPHAELDIWSRVPGLRQRCPALRQVLAVGGAPGALDFDDALAQHTDTFEAPRLQPADTLAALFHTGGTTGAPKLAQHTHGNQLHAAWGAALLYGMRESDKILNGFPLFHVAGAFVYGLSALLAGAEVVLPTLLGLRNAAFVQRYWQFVERERITLLAAVPTVMATLLNVDPGTARLDSVRALLTGGSPLPSELARAFEQRYGKPVRNILGLTECAGVVSIEPLGAPRVAGSCGLPLPFVVVEAVHADGSRCEAGVNGVLRLRGPNVGPGYTDPARNAGTYSTDPVTAERWLNTGDIGHVDAEGRVFVTGREKDVIIRSSHNIDPQLIEEALLQHPAVLMAAAVGEPDEYAGELPVAYVTLKPGATVAADELLLFAQQHIPERPAYPKCIDIVASIPTTAIGKVYKPALRAAACERVLRERLQAAGLSGDVTARVEDTGGGLKLLFTLGPAAEPTQAQAALQSLMQPFALPWQVVD